jgi:hypothetical protein
MKAADISDETFLQACCDATRQGFQSATSWDVADLLDVPLKVALAKARKLIRRRLLAGCACGCRGDWLPLDTPGDSNA